MEYTNSKQLFAEACELIPGGVNSPVRAFKAVGDHPVFIERGEGAYLYDVDGNKIHVRAREEVAIAFQHEIDHLNGILFVDHIDRKNPFKNQDKMREI